MFAFTVTPAGYVSRIDEEECAILLRLVQDVAALLRRLPGGPGQPVDSRDPIAHLDFDPDSVRAAAVTNISDPALSRLFPPMSTTDPDLAEEMRILTVDELRQEKLGNLASVEADLLACAGTVTVAVGAEARWLAALTDLRLVLASRLGIEDDDDAEAVHDLALAAVTGAEDQEDAGRSALAALYSGVTWWQESLLRAVTVRHPEN